MSENKEDDELLKRILNEYFLKQCESDANDILTLSNLKRIRNEEKRCFSLEHKHIYEGWKKFLDGLPESKDEIVPSIQERFWRWKMYKKYVVEETKLSKEEERTRFAKAMRCAALEFDKFGRRYPISNEDLTQFRPTKGYQFKIKRK